MKFLALAVVLGMAALCGTAAGQEATGTAPLGSASFEPSAVRPVGWRGDWTGRYPGATPPTEWSRRVKGITTELKYQAAKPAGEPGAAAHGLEYFTIKDWLVSGPFGVDDPVKDIEKDLLGGEAAAEPAEEGKAGAMTWKFLRADVDTQSRHDHNGGTCGNLNVDFLFAFSQISQEKIPPKPEGDFANKVAYAHTYIYAPRADKVRLRIPFTGAAGRFWWNGKPTDLDAKQRDKTFDVAAVQGWNRLLVKISTANAVGKDGQEWRSAWLVAAYLEPIGPVAYETKNVAWMTKMTGRSMSQPVVVGDRIFLGSNISDLMCLSKASGKVLWLRTTSPYDALTAEERNAIPAVKEKIEPLLAQLERQNQEVVAAINAAISPQGLSSDQATDLDKKLKDKTDTEKKIHAAFAAVDSKKYPPYPGNEVSSSNATPCSDGTRVYWVCGGGMKGTGAQAIACFDLDGKRLWTRHEVMGSEEHGNHQSPALADGKLIYGVSHTLFALDTKTGAVIWKSALKDDMGYGNSPVMARVGDAAVVVTKGSIVRATDGGVICASNLNMAICDITPVVDGGIIYNSSRWRGWDSILGVVAVRLPASTADKSNAPIVWDPLGKEVGMPLRGPDYVIASPLYLNGTLYGVDMTGGVIAVDMQGRKGLYHRWLDGYNRYNRYVYGVTASPTAAGKYVYITDDAGYTHLLEPGPVFKEAGKNVLENLHFAGSRGNPCKQESFYTAPAFDGKFMYLRGEEYLYGIGEK